MSKLCRAGVAIPALNPKRSVHMQDVFIWLNDQLLRMQWLHDLVTWLVRDGFGLDTAGRIGGSVHFFIYDVI